MAKQNLILLPGLMCDASVWQHQIEALSAHANILIPDLSNSDSPQKMVDAVLQHAPDSFALAGHSMGGWVALEIMKAAPEHITKLALFNTTAKPDTQAKINARRSLIEQANRDEYDDIINYLAPLFVYRKEILPEVISMLKRNQSALIPQEQAMLERSDCVSILNNIICPTLVLHSEYDDVFSMDDSLQLSEMITDANLVVIREAGHMSLLEQPNQVSQAMSEWFYSQ